MDTDLETTARQGLRAYVDAVPMPPGDLDAVLRQAAPPRQPAVTAPGPTRRRWLVPVLAAAAVVLVTAGVSLAPNLFESDRPDPQPAAPPTGTPVLPTQIHSTNWPEVQDTATISDCSVGRAILLYDQSNGGSSDDLFFGPPAVEPRTVVVGVDGRRYREVEAVRKAAGQPAMLAPDGTRVAMPRFLDGRLALTVVDLATARARNYVDGPRAAKGSFPRLLSWSPDGRRIAYTTVGGGENGHPVAGWGRMGMFDLRTGRRIEYPAYGRVTQAAFSPDGRELAVQDGTSLVVIGLDGAKRRTIALKDYRYGLNNGASWSPDGRWLATSPILYGTAEYSGSKSIGPELAFVDATGRGLRPPASFPMPEYVDTVLGWRSPDRILVHEVPQLTDAEVDGQVDQNGFQHNIVEVTLSTGHRRRVAQFSDEQTGDASEVTQVRLATGLLADAEIRPVGTPDFGPPPARTWSTAWIAAALVAVVPPALAAGVVVLVAARRRSRYRAAADTDVLS